MNILSATGDLVYFMILMLKIQFDNAEIPANGALGNPKKQIDLLRIKKFQNPIGSAYILILKTNRRLW